jgi:hypothetical protein
MSTIKTPAHPQVRSDLQVKRVFPHLGIYINVPPQFLLPYHFSLMSSAHGTTIFRSFSKSVERCKFGWEIRDRITISRTSIKTGSLTWINDWLKADIMTVPTHMVSETVQLQFHFFISLSLSVSLRLCLSHTQQNLVVQLKRSINKLKRKPHWYNSLGKNYFVDLFRVLIAKEIDPILQEHTM